MKKDHLVALAQFRQALRKFLSVAERNARAVGITPQQYQAMLAVYGRSDRDWATVSEIAEALQLRHHAASELLNRCEAVGLLIRSRDAAGDRRTVQVRLTPEGLAALESVAQLNIKEIQEIRRMVDDLDQQACA